MKKRVIRPLPIRGSAEIDLDSHAVIEASAGTGKTHTIEHLVVDLLRGGRVRSLDEILVVTFTEKATGELKDRIRKIITESLKKEKSDILQMSLDAFDTASIFTIHGFCNKILQEYAFENGEQFINDLVDDRVVYEKALYRIMREEWPRRYGDSLQKVLTVSQFPGSTASGVGTWLKRVIDVALRYQPAGNDMLYPDGGQYLMEKISLMENECHALLDRLLPLAGQIDENDPGRSELCARYASLNIRKNSIPKRVRIITAVLKLLTAHRTRKISLEKLSVFSSGLEIGDAGFNELNEGWNKSGPDYEEKLPHLPRIIEILEQLRSLDLPALQNLLAANTIQDLKHASAEDKKAHGRISYDDMVNRVYAALAEDSGTLKHELRKRYRYALVDEFQDTDMLQWNIFRTIFLESEKHKLYIIGDPKQAIYGFRGADVNAYYIARDEMISAYGARSYSLTENWRSAPELIRCFNTIFADANWFTDGSISYLPNHYPDEKEPYSAKIVRPLVVMQCGACSGTEAKYKSADYFALEIIALTSNNPDLELNEMAILVTKWKEADAVEQSLKKANISYSYYKKEGLYQSREALELSYLLTAIAKPHDTAARKKALVTRFFRVPLHELNHYNSISSDHPAAILFEKWIAFAERKNWSLLFQSIMEDSGILYRTDVDDYDRSIINYRTIMQNLEVDASRRNLSILEIASQMERLRSQNIFAHESHNIEKTDMDKPGVQILTIHASKGLQFRIVFIGGGFSRRDISDFWTYHRYTRRVFDLVRDAGNRDLHDRELRSEEERLFYVALTRAKDRLYVPVFEPAARAKGTAGILGGKLPNALQAVRYDSQVIWIDIDFVEPSDIGSQGLKTDRAPIPMIPDPLFPDPAMNFLHRKISVASFSGLKAELYEKESAKRRHLAFGESGSQAGEDDVSTIAPGLPDSEHDALRELPRSTETGLMLHEILEQIDFHHTGRAKNPGDLLADKPGTDAIITAAVNKHMRYHHDDVLDHIRNETARILWNTLRAPLHDSGLVLGDLKRKIHEVEFYNPASLRTASTVPEISYTDGFIHGFIDMIFQNENKYYIVDWKSNFIEEGYTREHIEKSINDMHYDLQIKIYSSALISWLKRVVPGYLYNRDFGGVYYLYLRGMDINHPGSGIYFCRPETEAEAMDLTPIIIHR